MAFKKTLVQRLFNLSRFSTPSISRTTAAKPPSEPPEPSRIKRNMQRRPLYQAAMPPSSAALRLFPPTGENLVEKLKELNVAKDRIRLSGLIPLPEKSRATAAREEESPVGLSASEVRKVLRASQVELIRSKLNEVERDWVTYEEFMELIEESVGGNKDQAFSFAKSLDDSGSVIVLGNAVCLRPHQVAKAIQSLVTPAVVSDPNDPRMQELELLEEQKAEIDQKAEALVRRELWAGLGYMVVQTAAFMRLTFWELSWDVMEPICFYVTSVYFMLGYTFFLRTAKEPSFEGFYQSRFSAKQKRLMKTHNFDIERYTELRKAFDPHYSSSSLDKRIKYDQPTIN
ncbi:calcium uniporter protein 2, mitochondrial-like isoform X2 [Chenopodium quinoa]|uniref:Calcium uniporter protein C-terminal domain-containing protein n=1 Tax=Chenopodium quinoa TaxID=63459 RepID=A0A803KVZ5_CHEQI|nr:calcium uniporter protein 2, mitochondrial-like isoform X2 [Chenopodium quinoa]